MPLRTVVIGASIGGLLAARTLADHAEQVTLLDHDTFPPVGGGRRHVPQGAHVHGLMARGLEVIEDLLPGLTGELAAHGAPLVDPRLHGRWFLNGGYHDRRLVAAEQPTLLVSRPLLEGVIRERVLRLPNVRAIARCDVVGLITDDTRRRVIGVRVLRRQAGSAEETVPADVVVDASGRRSRTPAWLEALGYPPPVEEHVRVDLTYTSRWYRRRTGDLGGDDFAMVFPDPTTRRAGVVAAQDGDRWLVTLIGYLGEHAPTDDAGYYEYARTLAAPDLFDVVGRAEPVSRPVVMRFPGNQRRRYDRLPTFPEGLVITGDALCSFNPVYAQGMTVAALEALALGHCVAAGTDRIGQRFFDRTRTIVDDAWRVSALGDLRFPDVEGKRTPTVRFVNWYLDRLHLAAHRDAVVATAFQRVVNMLAPPSTLVSPQLAIRIVCRNALPGRLGRQRRLASVNPPAAALTSVPQAAKASSSSGPRP